MDLRSGFWTFTSVGLQIRRPDFIEALRYMYIYVFMVMEQKTNFADSVMDYRVLKIARLKGCL